MTGDTPTAGVDGDQAGLTEQEASDQGLVVPEQDRSRNAGADERDAAADRRDEAAATRDRVATKLARLSDMSDTGDSRTDALAILVNAQRDRQRASAAAARDASGRLEAARDRRESAEDRRQAALDRAIAEAEIRGHGTDPLTGSLLRAPGLAAMQREWDRTKRTDEAFVVAFIDVNGLKVVNDGRGHQAGDELLQAVARCIEDRLRPYDVIARYGGDEFVVTMSGQDDAGVGDRFDLIADDLARAVDGASITVGVAERQTDESLTVLVDQADTAMRSHRHRRS